MPLRTIFAALLLLILPASAHAALDELLGKYATTDDGCESGTTPEFEIRRGIVEGPEFALHPRCTEGGRRRSRSL